MTAHANNLNLDRERHTQPVLATEGWADTDWIAWWENIENLYLSGVEYEGLYWLLRHDLELLGYYQEFLTNIEVPRRLTQGGPTVLLTQPLQTSSIRLRESIEKL